MWILMGKKKRAQEMMVSRYYTSFLHCFHVHFTMIDFVDSAALGTSRKHYLCRKRADDHYRLNAKRMREKYDAKKVHIFTVGDVVTVRIPRIDRAATDLHRLPCVIVQKLGRSSSSTDYSASFVY